MSIIQYLLRNTERSPEKTAIIFADNALKYRDFTEQTRRVSGALSKAGVGEGTHIGLIQNNSVEFVAILFAAADLGATIVPMSSTTGSQDLLTAIRTTNMDYLIGWHAAVKDILKRLQEEFPLTRERCITVGGEVGGCLSFEEIVAVVPEAYDLGKQAIDEENDFILGMTSGSTSTPKPVVFTQGTKIRRCFSAVESYNIKENDIILVGTPLYHSISQRLILLPLIMGGTSVIMQRFTPKNWLAQIEKHQVTFTISISSQLENILWELEKTKADLSSLRSIVSCCALLKNEIKMRLIEEMKCEFHECYGASEVGVISNLTPEDAVRKLHTVGTAVPGVEIRIADSEKNPVPTGEIGEIASKSIMCFSRYYNNEQATKESIVDSYFYTGDMGYLDEEGYLVFSGRKKEMIITGGTNVYPKDVESVISQHEKVKECVVIGLEDKQLGEAILAVVIPEEGVALTGRELQIHCLHRLADYQQPLAYEFVDDFPRTELGKVIKRKLVEQRQGYDLTEGLRAALKKS